MFARIFYQQITRILLIFTRDTRDTWRPNTPQGIFAITLICFYQQIRCTASRPVMQGIVTARSHKDFQPPLGIFLPSKEKEIIILENQIILLGKIPVSNV